VKLSGIEFADIFPAAENTMNNLFLDGPIIKDQAVFLIGLAVCLCACRTADADYANRNDTDSARSRCVELAHRNGYRDVSVDSIERDGAEWNVRLVVRKSGKDRRERCEYNARTNTVNIDD
jgi:hypothetical protein